MATQRKEAVAYRSSISRSKQLFDKAQKVLPGGNSRHSVVLNPYPIYVSSGKGAYLTDADGETRIDFLNNYTSLIHGHANDQIIEAVKKQLEKGTAFANPTELEIELASLIADRMDYIDKVRFCNSGSEAVMLAIKAARAFSGKAKIAKMEGAYHGIYDHVQVSEGPVPDNWGDPMEPNSIRESSTTPSTADDVIVMPWNNKEACLTLIERHKDELAAVLIDPMPAGIGFILPQPGFLESIRDLTSRLGILLVADEVITVRLSYGGGCHDLGIKPDLTAMAKIIGGGFPVGAVGGRSDVMEVFDHTKGYKVHHGGTFNANPITTTAGLAAMKLMTPQEFDRINALGDQVRTRIGELFAKKEFPAQVTGKGSLFWVHLSDEKLVGFRSLYSYSKAKGNQVFNQFAHEMLARGIVTAERGLGCLSTAMGQNEIDAYLEALEGTIDAIR